MFATDGCSINHEEQNISSSEINVFSITSAELKLTLEMLCNNWGIVKALTDRTIEGTTLLRVLTVEYPSIKNGWPKGDRTLSYLCLVTMSTMTPCIVK
jgi:hypothetical protein